MKQVIQLDDNGYFTGVTVADPSPLEPSVYLMPANTVDVDAPTVPDGHLAKWDGAWVFEAIPEPEVELEPEPLTYAQLRATAYPSIQEQLDMQYWDGVNGTTIWADTIASVKSENPKP